MSDGNGNGFGIDPKWDSFIDKIVRETLETLGHKVGALGLDESERWHAELATARALIYAACAIVWGYTDEDADKVKVYVEVCLSKFLEGLQSESPQ